MGTSAENKALVARFIEGLNTGDVAMAAACFDADRYYSHAHQADLAGTWEAMKARRKNPAWSDFSSESVALIADGDRVVHHSRATATHTGEVLGIPGQTIAGLATAGSVVLVWTGLALAWRRWRAWLKRRASAREPILAQSSAA